MTSITKKFLAAQIERLNRATGSPLSPYVREDGKCVAQVGNYHLSGAYGGYSLHRMTPGGGISDVFRCGHVSKRSLSERISAMLCGIEAARAEVQERIEDRLHEMDVFTR